MRATLAALANSAMQPVAGPLEAITGVAGRAAPAFVSMDALADAVWLKNVVFDRSSRTHAAFLLTDPSELLSDIANPETRLQYLEEWAALDTPRGPLHECTGIGQISLNEILPADIEAVKKNYLAVWCGDGKNTEYHEKIANAATSFLDAIRETMTELGAKPDDFFYETIQRRIAPAVRAQLPKLLDRYFEEAPDRVQNMIEKNDLGRDSRYQAIKERIPLVPIRFRQHFQRMVFAGDPRFGG